MTIEEKLGISQENKKYYSKIKELVNYISENMKLINKLSRGTNKGNKLIKIMFSYIKNKHNFNKEWDRIELSGEGNILMNTTYEHKEAYIKLLTEEIKNYVELVKNNKNRTRRNYVESVKNNKNITKESLYELLNEKNLDKLGDKFIVDLEVIKGSVKETFKSSLTEKIVQQSYVTKINNDPDLSEQAKKVREKTALEISALERSKGYYNSFF